MEHGKNKEERMFIVYKHTNKINDKVYIGITCNLKHRWVAKGYMYTGSPYFNHALKKYGWDNFEHEILFEGLTEKEARKKETELIKLYRSNDSNYGYNLTEGGEHNIPNKSVRDKISKTQKALMTDEKRQLLRERAIENDYSGERNPFYGKHHDETTRKRMSDNQWAKKDPERFLKVVSKNLNCGGDESRFAKQIVRLIDGKSYPSIMACAEDNNVHIATITNHCLKRNACPEYAYYDDYKGLSDEEKQSLMYILKDKKAKPYKYRSNTKAVVCMMNKTVFHSVEACHVETGKDYKTIINQCKGKDTHGKPLKTPQKFMYLSDYIEKYGDSSIID